MSVLSFPRLYFKGYMEWNPCTFNNNDWSKFQTYDATHAALNWSYLAQLTPPITQANFRSALRPWAISLQADDSDQPPGSRVPAEWNMFGDHGVSFVQYDKMTTTITGGDLAYNQPATNDSIIGGPVVINGDIGGQGRNPGRLVDTNPSSPWSSQIYFGHLAFGTGDNGISGPRAYRMHSRWLNPYRIFDNNNPLTQPAASIGVCFQTCIPFASVAWPNATTSQLINTLKQAAAQPGALGIMMRFTAYVNVYFANGIFNDIAVQPRNYEELAAALATAWQAWNTNGDASQFFSQPCYSHIVGAVGVWNEGELASVPGGRSLAAGAPVFANPTSDLQSAAPIQPRRIIGHETKTNISAVAGSPVPLGPVAVNIDYTNRLISLDMSGTMPENGTPGQWPSDLSKANFGTLTLGVMKKKKLTVVATIEYEQYARAAYEARAGIIDIPFPNPGTGALLKSGPLAIQAEGKNALLEQVFTAETDTRGIYLDQTRSSNFDVTVFNMGEPSAGAGLMVAQYYPDAQGNLDLIASDQPQLVGFTTGTVTPVVVGSITSLVTILTTDSNGVADVGIAAQNPGFPVLAFIPYPGGTTPPPPPAGFNFTDSAFYTTVRVLPFDDLVPQSFVDLWNGFQDQETAWNFIYFNILYVYDMMFNVMLEYVDLGNRQTVEQSISSIWFAITQELAVESTYAMPITRDMSAGKRLTLQLWIYLVANNYNVPDFNVNSIPAGWTPPG